MKRLILTAIARLILDLDSVGANRSPSTGSHAGQIASAERTNGTSGNKHHNHRHHPHHHTGINARR